MHFDINAFLYSRYFNRPLPWAFFPAYMEFISQVRAMCKGIEFYNDAVDVCTWLEENQ
jgi:hypothetical protein